jgi:hypothetical protein
MGEFYAFWPTAPRMIGSIEIQGSEKCGMWRLTPWTECYWPSVQEVGKKFASSALSSLKLGVVGFCGAGVSPAVNDHLQSRWLTKLNEQPRRLHHNLCLPKS